MRRTPTVIEQLYRHTAPRYQAAITPVMRPFARRLVSLAPLTPADSVLDIGTGTGIVIDAIDITPRRNIGVDIVMPMLRIARSSRAGAGTRTTFLQMDANSLAGLVDDCVDVAFASFGLADCQPDRVFRAIARVLRPGGRLYLQEWGPVGTAADPRAVVDDVLADYATETAGGIQFTLREHLAAPRPWDAFLQDADDYRDALQDAGFTDITVTEDRPLTVTFDPGVARFLAFALAWAPRHFEVQALPWNQRRAFFRAAGERLSELADPAGAVHWQPLIFTATGVRML